MGFTYPQIFLSAFAFAGIIFAFIGVFLPVALAYKSRKVYPKGEHTRGGNLSLILAVIFAIVIVIAYILTTFVKVLPSVVG